MGQPNLGREDGYSRDIGPVLEGERKLDELSGLWDLVTPFAISGQVALAAGTTTPTVVVCSRFDKGREGVLIAYALENEADDFPNTPWWIKTASRNGQIDTADPNAGVQNDGIILQGPFRTQVGAMATPFAMPFPLPIMLDKQVAIFATNNTGAEAGALGFLYGITWQNDQTREIRRALWRQARRIGLWEPGLFGGAK